MRSLYCSYQIFRRGVGRKTEIDNVLSAAYVAKQYPGTPVQLVYSREEDLPHDMYRPTVKSQFRAKLDDSGAIEAWENKLAQQSVKHSFFTRLTPAFAPSPEEDGLTTIGAIDLPYEIMRMNVAPAIEVHIMEVDEYPGGVIASPTRTPP